MKVMVSNCSPQAFDKTFQKHLLYVIPSKIIIPIQIKGKMKQNNNKTIFFLVISFFFLHFTFIHCSFIL